MITEQQTSIEDLDLRRNETKIYYATNSAALHEYYFQGFRGDNILVSEDTHPYSVPFSVTAALCSVDPNDAIDKRIAEIEKQCVSWEHAIERGISMQNKLKQLKESFKNV